MRRRPWLVASLLALLGVALLGTFPVRAYLGQQHQRDVLADRVASLAAENQRRSARIDWLKQDDTIERLARDRYQLVRPGEEAYAILPSPPAPPAAGPAASPPPPPHKSWVSRMWSKVTSVL